MRKVLIICIFYSFSDGAAAQVGRIALANAAALMQQEQKAVDSTVNALIRIKEDSLTTDSVKVEIVHFLAKLACDTCLLYLIDHMNDRFNYGSGSADIDQYNWTACWSLLTSLGNREPTRWKVFAAVFRSLQTKPRDDSYFDFIVSVLVSVTPEAALKSIVAARLADINIQFDRVYIQNLKRLQVELNK